MDGSDGGIGGHLACTITGKGVSCLGTAHNKSSSSSTLIYSSNVAGEPIPMDIMFSSDEQEDNNFQVNDEWITNHHRAFVQFWHKDKVNLPSSITMNSKGGTNSRVLVQVLL